MSKTTFTTTKQRLFLTIAAFYVTTFAASLTCVASINVNDTNSLGFCLVGQELLKLEETPRVDISPLILTNSLLSRNPFFFRQPFSSLSNIRQFFENNRISYLKGVHNLLRDAMIHIGSKPSLLASDRGEVSLSRATFFRLQLFTLFSVFVSNKLNLSSTKKLVRRCYSKFLDSSINPNEVAIWNGISDFLLEYDTQEYFPMFVNHKFSRFVFPNEVLLKVLRYIQLESFSSIHSENRNRSAFNPERIGVLIQTDRTLLRLRTSGLLPVLSKRLDRLQALCCFHPSGHSKLRRQCSSCLGISKFVEIDTIGFFGLETNLADEVIGISVSLECAFERFKTCIESNFCCSYQLHILYLSETEKVSFNKFEKFSQKGGGGNSSTTTRVAVSLPQTR